MSGKRIKQELALPPNVNGDYNGYLELKVEGFKWRGNKKFNLIQAKFKFWGQDNKEVATIWFSPHGKSEPESLKYRIVTTTNLFKSYLQHAEPVQVKLISLKSNNLIGTSAIRIPAVIVSLRSDGCGKILATDSTLIFSPKGFVLGSIFTTFRVRLVRPLIEILHDEPAVKEMPTTIEHRKPIPLPEDPEILTMKRTSTREKDILSEFVLNNVPSISSSDYTTTISSSIKDYNESQKSCIINYLSGKDIPKEAEGSILKEICKISPAASLIDILRKETHSDSSPISEHVKPDKLNFNKSQLLKHIDSIRFVLHGFLATKAGIKEIMKKFTINNMKTFNIAIECQISAGAVRSTDNNTMYFLSKTLNQNDLIHRVDINKQNYRALNNTKKFFEQNNISMTFVLWIRDSTTKISYILGASRVPLGQMLRDNLSYKATTAIKLVNSDTVVGVLSFYAELGCRKTIFGSVGSELGVTCNQENSDTEKSCGKQPTNSTNVSNSVGNDRQSSSIGVPTLNGNNKETTQTQNVKVKVENGKETEVMSSLLYFGSIRDGQGTANLELRLTYFDLFTNESIETNFSCSNAFNLLKVFPVIINDDFLNKMKHNYILVEVFQKNNFVVLATIKLPLHQFYIAFRDNDIKSHLSKAKLPVISIDGWNNLISTVDNVVYGQIQVLLAVGTEMQIETLKVTRGLSTNSPIFQGVPHTTSTDHARNVETQTAPNNASPAATVPMSNMLSSFIENLANKLPDRGPMYPEKVPANMNLNGQTVPQMRNTAELLEMLQKALTERPNVQNNTLSGTIPTPVPFNPPTPMPLQPNASFKEAQVIEERGFIRVAVEIECAKKLPIIRMSRKNHKKNKGKASKGSGGMDIEPSAYVTFEAQRGQESDQVRSHEGIVYATQVVEHSCEPAWHKTFEVSLSADILWNDEKNFILKVWRKSSPADTKQFPTPLHDAVIGFTAVNLRPLLSGVPTISGWYNIMDFSGRNNGQVKVSVRLLSSIPDRNSCCMLANQSNLGTQQNESSQVPVTDPLHIETDDNDFSNQLGRALKRKFTELEEISQRLKARLFDVTAEPDDEDFDPDEEFEHDLNTVVESDEDEAASRKDFGWLGQDKAIFTATLMSDQESEISYNKLESDKESETANLLQLSDFDTSTNFFQNCLSSCSDTEMNDIATTSQGIGHLSEVLKETTISDEKPCCTTCPHKNPDATYKKDDC